MSEQTTTSRKGHQGVNRLTRSCQGRWKKRRTKYLYDPYGITLSLSGPLASLNLYRFSSKEWNQIAGLYYYLHRFYDPNLQRWLNRDSMQEGGGLNLYGFVKNDPRDKIDYLGLDIGTVSVDENHSAGPSAIGWIIKLRWTPPESWKGQKPNCLPCQEAVWVQDKNYDIEYFSWQLWLKDVHTGWTKDWDETDYEGSALPWFAYSRGANWNSTMHDEPGVGLAKAVFFSANAKVKCIAGRDTGQIYATVEWGYFDFSNGSGESSGGGLGY